jgi:nucleotide-binding universal stress UspA family protein
MRWSEDVRVKVLAAAPPAVCSYPEAYAVGGGLSEQADQEQIKHCEQPVGRVEADLRAAGLDATGQVVRGDPREAIVHAARAGQADLVVIGSHGRSGLAKLVLGSVTSYVVSHSHCNVQVVKLPVEAP